MRLSRPPSSRKLALQVALASAVFITAFNTSVLAQGQRYSKRVQELVDLGYSATQIQNWDLAIRYFSDAQKELPHDPGILSNLGLANEKAGKPLASIIWFRASLATSQSSSDVPKIEKHIRDQKILAQSAMQEFMSEAFKAGFPSNSLEVSDVDFLAYLLREAGDIEEALEMTKRFSTASESEQPVHRKTPGSRHNPLRELVDDYEKIAQAALDEGDTARAVEALQLAETVLYKMEKRVTSVRLADLWQRAGNTQRAISILHAAREGEGGGCDALGSIAVSEFRARDMETARKDAEAYAASCVRSGDKYNIYSAIRAQTEIGDYSGGRNTMKALKDSDEPEALAIIGEAEFEHGEIELARLSVSEYEEATREFSDPRDWIEFAGQEIKVGDLAFARKHLALAAVAAKRWGNEDLAPISSSSILRAASMYKTIGNDAEAHALLSRVLAGTEKDLGARLKGLVDENQLSASEALEILQLTSETQSHLGDLSGAQRTLEVMKTANYRFSNLREVQTATAKALGAVATAEAEAGKITIARRLLTEMQDCNVQFNSTVELAKVEAGRGKSDSAQSILNDSETSDWLDLLDAPYAPCSSGLRLKLETEFDPRDYMNEVSKDPPAKFPEALMRGATKIAGILGSIHKTEMKWATVKSSFLRN